MAERCLGSNTWRSAGGPPQPDGVAGLHQVALNSPTLGEPDGNDLDELVAEAG